MANSLTTQIEQDGPRHATVKITGIVNTADIAQTTVVAPASFSPTPYNWRVMHIDYSIQAPLNIELLWHATVDALMVGLAGYGRMSFQEFGGLLNNAGAGVNGAIDLLTVGWSATASAGTQAFTIVLRLEKVGPDGVGVK